jgi:acetoin utilization deacetylase AcuC-like enzyme
MAPTAFLYHPSFLEHDGGPGHPECPQRLTTVVERLERQGLLSRALRPTPEPSTVESIQRVHAASYVEHLAERSAVGRLVPETMDTMVSPATYGAALLAAGAVQQAVDAVIEGRADNAFCAVRPPGHHAEGAQAMGFCYFNNIAIAARHAQERHRIERVAIVDWDVHHGNGTQHSFESDPSVFFFSIHQYPHYPGTGARHEQGRGPGAGYTLNAPVPAGAGDADYEQIFREELRPALDSFHPDLILVSAGFDAHAADPLSDIRLTEEGFASLTRQVLQIARDHCQGRLVATLEGGYSFDATAAAVQAHLQVLMQD